MHQLDSNGASPPLEPDYPAHNLHRTILGNVPTSADQEVRSMREEVWVASIEPAAGVFTTAGTCLGRLRRHCVIGYADPGQNPSAVRFGSSRVRGRGLGRAGRGHDAGETPLGDGEQDQRLTATAAATGQQQRPATAHNARTIRANSGYVRPEKRTVVRRRRPTENLAYARLLSFRAHDFAQK